MKTIITTIKEPDYKYIFPQPIEDIAFFDIETTGLSPKASSIYLIGFLSYDVLHECWELRQWFANDYQSESKIIIAFLEALSHRQYLYHFNGKTFDIPYVIKKCFYHSIPISEHCKQILEDSISSYSIDLLSKMRSLKKILNLDHYNQTSIEKWLGIHRKDLFNGKELISVYSQFMQEKILHPDNCEHLEKTLLLHNQEDVQMMLELCSILVYDDFLSSSNWNTLISNEQLQQIEVTSKEENSISLSLPLSTPIPKEISLTCSYPISNPSSKSQNNQEFIPSFLPEKASLAFHKKDLQLNIPLFNGTLKFFYPDYKEYYYLPEEDMAIHKSVAEFVDSTHRKKATAATCYTKKEGVFLPNLYNKHKNNLYANIPLFYSDWKSKTSFLLFPDLSKDNSEFWRSFLQYNLPCFR